MNELLPPFTCILPPPSHVPNIVTPEWLQWPTLNSILTTLRYLGISALNTIAMLLSMQRLTSAEINVLISSIFFCKIACEGDIRNSYRRFCAAPFAAQANGLNQLDKNWSNLEKAGKYNTRSFITGSHIVTVAGMKLFQQRVNERW